MIASADESVRDVRWRAMQHSLWRSLKTTLYSSQAQTPARSCQMPSALCDTSADREDLEAVLAIWGIRGLCDVLQMPCPASYDGSLALPCVSTPGPRCGLLQVICLGLACIEV